MFDSAVFAHWPRGLFLAKKLAEAGRKTAYIEILPRLKSPFGFFLDESSKQEKDFLESLGFLLRQEGGFCLLSPEGVWPLQDMAPALCPTLKNQLPAKPGRDFDKHWLAYLSLNLAGRVFEHNDSEFSKGRLPIFSDYFLFEAEFKKAERFKKDHPDISFFRSGAADLFYKNGKLEFLAQGLAQKSEECFWLAGPAPPFLKAAKSLEPYWRWESCFLKADFGDYEDTVPARFVSIKNLFLPWANDNLLSAFREKGQLEIWMRIPRHKIAADFLKGSIAHLEGFFKGADFEPIEGKNSQGPALYSPESLKISGIKAREGVYIENLNDFFQIDLAGALRAEGRLFEGLS